jgi:hypothetical protein
VPVQSTVVTQVETFDHTYMIEDKRDAGKVFGTIMGKDNICSGNVPFLWDGWLGQIVAHQLKVLGTMVISLAPSVQERGAFTIVGTGDYMAYGRLWETQSDRVYLASADFRVEANYPYTFGQLKTEARKGTGWGILKPPLANADITHVDVVVNQAVVRQFDPSSPRYLNQSRLAVRVYLRVHKEDVYSIEYSLEHEVGLATKVAPGRYEAVPIGCLRFDGLPDGRKLVDLREANSLWLYKDYAETIPNADKSETRDVHVQWIAEPACVCKDSGCQLDLHKVRTGLDVIGSVGSCASPAASAPPPSTPRNLGRRTDLFDERTLQLAPNLDE